jgi:hypothetical protein
VSFDTGVFDPEIFGANLLDSCLFDPAVFDEAVFDVCIEDSPDREASLSGQQIVVSPGFVVGSGVEATFFAGDVGGSHTVALTGSEMTSEAGDLTYSEGEPEPEPEPEVVPDIVPAGSNRRRYILPDGRQVLATRRDVERLLEQFMEPEVKKTKSEKKAAVVEAMGLIDLKPTIIQVKLPPQYAFKPDPKTYEEALRAIQRRLDDEEAILLLI